MAGKLKITYTRSAIRMVERHKRAVRALGLRKLYQTVIHDDTPNMRGMIRTVEHLVTVEEI
ncbi:MAG: 50S ribosomal protein L30 [candidate division Zixibacteria bacterium]|nr:50S ribosomal protein L30 [candidate division Zixibacteria bacterium]